MKIKPESFLLICIIFKILLDFLSPYNFTNAILFFISSFFLLKKFPLKKRIYSSLKYFLGFYLFMMIYLALTKSDFGSYVKTAMYPFLVLIFSNVGYCLKRVQLENVFKNYWRLFFILFLFSLVLSIVLGLYSKREFLNFEHVNLLGSYVVISCIPLFFLNERHPNKVYLLLAPIMGFLTTSTGAFLITLGVFFRLRKISLNRVLIIIIALVFFVIILNYSLSYFSPDLYTKIFSPFLLFQQYSFGEFIDFALKQSRIQDLGDEYSSSLIWRFYVYVIYINYVFSNDIFHILFGNGLYGFSKVLWDGKPPHNDFILLLVDYGVVTLASFIMLLIKVGKYIISQRPFYITIFIMIILRLLFENNFNSFYITSHLVIFTSLLYGYFIANREHVTL